MTNKDLEKLPKWARDTIARLLTDNTELRKKLDNSVISDIYPPTNLWLESEIGQIPSVWTPSRFHTARLMLGDRWNEYIDFRIDTVEDKREVHVRCGKALVVRPYVSNVITLRIE